MESWLIILGLPLGVVALILWAGRNDDSSESTFQNVRRGVLVLGAIAVVFVAISWVATYGN